MRLWIVSNGFGEDQAASGIGQAVRARRPACALRGVPLVGDGSAYLARGIAVAVKGAHPHSGGFSTVTAGTFARDLPAFPAYLRVIRHLHRQRTPADGVLVVGDVFALVMGRLALGSPTAFVSLAKSEWHQPHTALERYIMQRWCSEVLTRDRPTARALARQGVRARHLGNPLMDGLEPSCPLPGGEPLVALLPGSRREAGGNLRILLEVAGHLAPRLRLAVALPPWFDATWITRTIAGSGWRLGPDAIVNRSHKVAVYRGRFADVMHAATLAVGMAGSAHEQAAGLGCVVVTCRGTGPQSRESRLRQQERLLGGAAVFVDGPADAVAARAVALLNAPEERQWRAEAGRQRMGRPGASDRIAEVVVDRLRPRHAAAG